MLHEPLLSGSAHGACVLGIQPLLHALPVIHVATLQHGVRARAQANGADLQLPEAHARIRVDVVPDPAQTASHEPGEGGGGFVYGANELERDMDYEVGEEQIHDLTAEPRHPHGMPIVFEKMFFTIYLTAHFFLQMNQYSSCGKIASIHRQIPTSKFCPLCL